MVLGIGRGAGYWLLLISTHMYQAYAQSNNTIEIERGEHLSFRSFLKFLKGNVNMENSKSPLKLNLVFSKNPSPPSKSPEKSVLPDYALF